MRAAQALQAGVLQDQQHPICLGTPGSSFSPAAPSFLFYRHTEMRPQCWCSPNPMFLLCLH